MGQPQAIRKPAGGRTSVPAGQPLRACTAANQEWALDFVHDAVAAGRAIWVLSIVDGYTRECLALEVDSSFASRRVSRVLEEIIQKRGLPQSIRCDNGPERMQNGRCGSFNGRLREECLRVSWFENLFDARRKIADWRRDYNEVRPHSSLAYRTPAEFAALSRGKDAGSARLENADRVPHFPTAPAAANFV